MDLRVRADKIIPKASVGLTHEHISIGVPPHLDADDCTAKKKGLRCKIRRITRTPARHMNSLFF